MKRILAIFFIYSLSVGNNTFAQQPPAINAATPQSTKDTSPAAPPTPNTLLDGTDIKLRLSETISSADAKVGQQVPFEVTEEVDVQGVPVIAKGAKALATVTAAETKKSMGRAGKLDVNIDSVRLIDNEQAQLRAQKDVKGGGHTGAMTGAMVATAIVFFPAAPLFLFMKGKDISIPKGTEITAFVQGDMKLDMTKFQPQTASSGPSITSTSQANLIIDASVPSADIEVDGNFVGNTPSTITLTAGKHTIVVKKKGYADWTRTMSVSTGNVHLNADMEAASAQTPPTIAK